MNDDRKRIAEKLQAQLADLRKLEAAAVKDGDEATLADLRVRIEVIEGAIAMLENRLDAMAAQSWHFAVERNAEGLISSILASPRN